MRPTKLIRETVTLSPLQEIAKAWNDEKNEIDLERWAQRHQIWDRVPFRFTRGQRKLLHRWFRYLDAEKKGWVSFESLSDAFITAGKVRQSFLAKALHDPNEHASMPAVVKCLCRDSLQSSGAGRFDAAGCTTPQG